MTNKENLQLDIEELKKKYGRTIVMGVDKSIVSPYLKSIYTPKDDLYHIAESGTKIPFMSYLNGNLRPMLRYEAEVNPEFKQVIPYVIVRNGDKVFCTHRLNGGDARLAGSYSIGTGGHIDGDENIYDAMHRELREEVGITINDTYGYTIHGFILDESTAVNSVHLGALITMVVGRTDIHCLEKDKLAGEWMDYKKLRKLYDAGKLESWSEIAAREVLFGGEANERKK